MGTGTRLLLSWSAVRQALQLLSPTGTGGAAALSVEKKYWTFIEYQLSTLGALLEPVVAYFISTSQWHVRRVTHSPFRKAKKKKGLGMVTQPARGGSGNLHLGRFVSMLPS